MERISKIVVAVIAVVALVLGVIAVTRPANPILGSAGSDFYNQVGFYGGSVSKGSIATSSASAAETLTANELIAWANAGTVSYTPNLLPAITITLPASSTLKALLPNVGDRQSFCIRNATTTAGSSVIFAGGLGTKLLVASSSVSALGSNNLTTGKVGCMTLLREVSTSTAYDIDVLYTVFQ